MEMPVLETDRLVTRKLGMRVEHNPYPDPAWFQVVGILENRD